MAHDGYIDVALDLLRDLDTPRSLMVCLLIEAGEWSQLANLSVDPAHYLSADSYLRDAAATDLLRKVKNLPGSSAKALRHVALEKWLDAEKHCCRTNLRFRNYRSGYYPGVAPRIVEYLHDVKKLIAKVLGRIPMDLPECRHGKGATYEDKGLYCTVLHKMQSQPTCTAQTKALLPLLEGNAWMRALQNRHKSTPKVVRGNRFTTVPKTIKGDRAIAVEPSINIWFQLGVGSYIRRRLKRVALIDLDEGQETHAALAKEASITNAWATIDLSSASDTVSLELVRYLLPEDWASLLETLRSPVTKVGNRTYVLEKFSSMGNGFTFELETLIFWACSQALVRGVTYVYGDDIIVPADKGADVLAALRFMGFIPNPEKTYLSGNFRESCGGDFFLGQAVRPYYLKEIPHEPQQWMSYANGLNQLGRRFSDNPSGVSHRVRRAHLRCLANIPSNIRRLKGPQHLGDAVICDDDRSKWSIRVNKDGHYEIRTYTPVTRDVPFARFDPDVQLAGALYGVPSTGAKPRKGVTGYRETWVPLSEEAETKASREFKRTLWHSLTGGDEPPYSPLKIKRKKQKSRS